MWMKRITIIFGISMALILALTTLLSAVGRTSQPPAPTAAPVPTFPPPPDLASIDFAQRILHPGGLYTVALPTGWEVSEALNTREGLRAVLEDEAAQSLIQVDVDRPPPRSLEVGALTLDDHRRAFQPGLAGRQLARIPQLGGKRAANAARTASLLIDFTLGFGGQTFVSRQQAWTDGEWIYSVRVVTPANATDCPLAFAGRRR